MNPKNLKNEKRGIDVKVKKDKRRRKEVFMKDLDKKKCNNISKG